MLRLVSMCIILNHDVIFNLSQATLWKQRNVVLKQDFLVVAKDSKVNFSYFYVIYYSSD